MITVRVPASTSNLGPGFDCLGLALARYLTVSVEPTHRDFAISLQGEGERTLPANSNNFLIKVIKKVAPVFAYPLEGMRLTCHNEIPIARGLGSSAAVIVAALLALNALGKKHLSPEELLALATDIEKHPDNVTPALLGGLTVTCLSGDKPITLKQTLPPTLKVVLAIPQFELATKRARQVLPKKVPLQDAVFNTGRSALLVGALITGQFHLLQEAMADRLHQEKRSELIPGMKAALGAAQQAGALGAALSGAGPSLLAFATEKSSTIADAMAAALTHAGTPCTTTVTTIDNEGAKILDAH